MTATQQSTSPRAASVQAIEEALNNAANAHHAIKATTRALSDAVYNASDKDASNIGMYEALWFSITALDSAISTAMEEFSRLEATDLAH